MYCPNGRVGKTTTSLAFAHEAQSIHNIKTCVLEFDFSPGDISSIFNLDLAKNILDAADGDFDVAIQRPENEEFDVILAGYPDYAEQLDSQSVINILEYLESVYDLVIVDIQPNFLEQVIDIFNLSTKIIMVLTNNQQDITRVVANLQWGVKSGYIDEDKIEVLINKMNKKDKIDFIKESALSYPLITSIPFINGFKGYNDERFQKYMSELIKVFFPDVINEKSTGFLSKLFGGKKTKESIEPTNNALRLTESKIIEKEKPMFVNKKKTIFNESEDNSNMLDLSDELAKQSKNELTFQDLEADKKKDNANEEIYNEEDIFKIVEEDNKQEDVKEEEPLDLVDIQEEIKEEEPLDLVDIQEDIKEEELLDLVDIQEEIKEKDALDLVDIQEDVKREDALNLVDIQEDVKEEDSHDSIDIHEDENSLDLQMILNRFLNEKTLEIAKLRKEKKSLEGKNKTFENSNKVLENMITNYKKEISSLQLDKNKLILENSKLEKKDIEHKNIISNLKNEIKNKNEYIEVLNNNCLELEKKYSYIKSEITKKLTSILDSFK